MAIITLTVQNSYSRITGLSMAQERALREALSYTVGNYFSGPFGPRKKSLLDKKGYFPTGLLNRVAKHLEASNIDFLMPAISIDRYKAPGKPVVITGIEPYEFQKRAATIAKLAHRGIISAPTGSGKSLIIALIAARLNVKTLVLVPSLEIKKQLSESLLELLKGKCQIRVENIDSFELPKLTDFDCLIIDEAHHAAAKTYQKLNKTAWAGIYYRYCLTATPFRNNTEEQLLFEGIAGNIICQLTYDEAVKNKYIVPVESYYLESPKQPTDAFTWAQVYSELVVNNDARNDLIALTALRLAAAGKSTLVLVREVEHGRQLAEKTGFSFITGADNDSRQYIRHFSNGGITAIIATTGIMAEGVDSKACEYVIVAGLGKAKSNFMQAIGRSVRNFPGKESGKVIIVKDKSHRFPLKHFREQCKILKEEYGSIPQKLEIK